MRAAIETLAPYKVQSDEGFIRLDNNECFLNLLSDVPISELQKTIEINRYPGAAVERLTAAYASYLGFPVQNILPGNGSDEWISLICQFALSPGDTIIVLDPDFSMYEKGARIMGASVYRIPLKADFSLPLDLIIRGIHDRLPKCLFLSNPNNPTGRFFTPEEIDSIAGAMKDVNGYFILDEAYIEFAGKSYIERVLNFEHVIVLRTASKALGMAGLRIGFLLTNDELIEGIARIKPPYNVNQLSATVGTYLLTERNLVSESLLKQKEQIESLKAILEDFAMEGRRVHLYPSSTNFFLLETEDAQELYEFLNNKKIKIRYFGQGRLKNAVRISIGTKEELAYLRESLKEWGREL